MAKQTTYRVGQISAALALVLGGCAQLEDSADGIGQTAQAVKSRNALTSNALTFNALTFNALSSTEMAPDEEATVGEYARELLGYIYSCAMPDGAYMELDINDESYGFAGSIGLAPQWGDEDGSCDETCQRWISACLLARVNALGVSVEISMRGMHPALTAETDEHLAYPIHEGAFYGNVFTGDADMLACRGKHDSKAKSRALERRQCVTKGKCGFRNTRKACRESIRKNRNKKRTCSAFDDGLCFSEPSVRPSSRKPRSAYDRDFAETAVPYEEVINVYLSAEEQTISCAAQCGSDEKVPHSSPACYCDSQCEANGDCCWDYGDVCM